MSFAIFSVSKFLLFNSSVCPLYLDRMIFSSFGKSEIILSIEKTKELSGSICEIGVARGMTTRFICEHLKTLNYMEMINDGVMGEVEKILQK